MKNRWKCPECSSDRVQICLPAWFTESADCSLAFVEADGEAEISAWYCEACGNSDSGAPQEAE